MKKWFHVTDIYSAYKGVGMSAVTFSEFPPDGTDPEARYDYRDGAAKLQHFLINDPTSEKTIYLAVAKVISSHLYNKFPFIKEIAHPDFKRIPENKWDSEFLRWQNAVSERYGEWHEVEALDDQQNKLAGNGLMIGQICNDITNDVRISAANLVERLKIYRYETN